MPAGHVPAASREGLDLEAFPLCCILALQTHEDLRVGFLEQSEHGLEGGHDPVVAPQTCGYHRLSLASVEQLMAEPARPWMGGLDSAAAQPWTSHLPGTSAGQRSWVLAAAGGQCHQECTESTVRRDETAQRMAGKGREGTGRGRKPSPGLWSSCCKAKGVLHSQEGTRDAEPGGCHQHFSPTPFLPAGTLRMCLRERDMAGHPSPGTILIPAHGCLFQ